jgi:hypothetical protein
VTWLAFGPGWGHYRPDNEEEGKVNHDPKDRVMTKQMETRTRLLNYLSAVLNPEALDTAEDLLNEYGLAVGGAVFSAHATKTPGLEKALVHYWIGVSSRVHHADGIPINNEMDNLRVK